MGNAADSPADCFFVHEQCLFFPHVTHHLSVFLFRPFQAGQEISRRWRFKMHGLPCNRMDQIETMRVKGLTVDREIILLVPVQGVVDDGMMDISHVDADLMSPARFQLTFDPGVIAIALQYFEMGHSFAATLKGDGHLDPIFGMAADRGIDDARSSEILP